MNNYQHQTPPPVTRHHHHHLPPPPPLPHHHPSLLPQSQPPLPMLPSQQQHGVQQQQQPQPLISNSLAIRQEIQRFESVHPSIYAIYDLIDLLPIADAQIAQQIRDHVVCIEDSFVNSQEWTISRSVPDLRLGIVGSLNSGKSALVHRYLTGSYMQEESPEGGRFKKEVFIDGQSYLLLIRDEGGPPEMQFAAWVDAVIFVFSLENESSFNTIYNYYNKMAHFRNGQDLPMILVGTQDAISERNPRVIDDSRARKLANDLKRCSYYETCATYGLNVERVFQDACQKILQQRIPLPPTVNSRPTTPQGTRLGIASYHHNSNNHGGANANGFSASTSSVQGAVSTSNLTLPHRHHALSTSSHHIPMRMSADFMHTEQQQSLPPSQKAWQQQKEQQQRDRELTMLTNENNNITKFTPTHHQQQQQQPSHQTAESLPPLSLVPLRENRDNGSGGGGGSGGGKDLPTPTSTPTTSRKSRRRSNLFIPSSSKKGEKDLKNGELGSGRSIPIKQGYLYKRSSKSLNKEWKKKYVTLCNDGRLTYHPSLHDYMDDVHGKEIPLQYVTVKVPGQKPRGSKSIITNSALTTSMHSNGRGHGQNGLSEGIGCLSIVKDNKEKKVTEKVLLTAFDTLREPVKSNSSQQTSGDEGIAMSNSNSQTFIAGSDSQQLQQQQRELLAVNAANKLESQTPNVKKRHRRMKSSSVKSNEVDDSDIYEFFIVSLDSKQWHFEAASSEDRDEWVAAIEQEIFKSLQGIESTKTKPATTSELASMVAIRTRVPGNGFCVDCDAPNPEWASLNLGVLMCIECSGIHRNLGSHISKVRSLGLDDWPAGHLSVMLAIGNSLANSVWEANTRQRTKPRPNSTREEKEAWIRSKYESKEFLAQSNANTNTTPGQQLIEAVIRSDIKSIVLILATANSEVTNANVSPRDVRTPLLLACAIGNLAIAQLLIWNGANIKHTDHEGRTCLAYARAAQSLATAKSLKAAAAAAAVANAANGSNTNTNSSTASNTSSCSSTASTTATTTTTSNATNSATASGATAAPATNGGIPAPQYSVEETTALVELLTSLGCPESAPLTASGTLPRRRDTLGTPYEKTVSGVI
ncbi:centaurin-gamma-1A isoform X1 [Bactrocera tryoni]|uniref:centaurin-gamma-1A isoform X1 n=2 Tax=Bactrocera tryoni TaxID=59916 RepID=UPI001A96769B|nr:centaurin-gamma-1A isoform X1 [Bactrocera tryoni]